MNERSRDRASALGKRWSALAVLLIAACQESASARTVSDAGVVQQLGPEAPAFCLRAGSDHVRDLFCTREPPTIDSLQTLQQLLAVGPVRHTAVDAGVVPRSYRANFEVLLGHSTSLSGQLVSSINPRALLSGDVSFMAYQRGVQQVEIATLSRDVAGLNFYLLTFQQACNGSQQGCLPGDLYTPRVEQDWQRVSIRDAEELKNTPLDCKQCHQRNRERPMLLMRELQAPWTHFFAAREPDRPKTEPGVDGADLVQDYVAAKGDEVYAGLDLSAIQHTVGFELEQVMPRDQPLLFDAPAIDAERWPYGVDGYATTPQSSPTWEAAYAAFKRGEQLALPYVETRASDPDKLAKLSEAYRQYRAGEMAAEQLPDLSDIFPDDAMLRARIGLVTEPDATPAQLLIQACGSCHNDVLDQTITRALFNIDITRMDRTELDRAIERIERDEHAEGVMPPKEFRQLDKAGRERLLEYLRAANVSAEDAVLLERAARLGMAGGGSDLKFAPQATDYDASM